MDKRSTNGYCTFLGVVARPNAEVEFKAMNDTRDL